MEHHFNVIDFYKFIHRIHLNSFSVQSRCVWSVADLFVSECLGQRHQQLLEDQADHADHHDGDDDVRHVQVFHSSQTQKPMPTPPVSISAATITSQAVPMARRTPVSM